MYMRNIFFSRRIARMVLPALLLPVLFSFMALPGGDRYEIYLNGKLILQQNVYGPMKLQSLALESATAKDQLVVHYSHCGTIGKSRSIAILDSHGKVLKKWSFADASGQKAGMIIPVKELLTLQKNATGQELVLVYSAKELPDGRQLTAFRFGKKVTA
jgi:hypothetical protein